VLHNELASYRNDLPTKARLVIVNKADQFETPTEIQDAKTKLDRIRRQALEIFQDQQALSGRVVAVPMKVVTLSAKKKQGTAMLAKTLVDLLSAQRDAENDTSEQTSV